MRLALILLTLMLAAPAAADAASVAYVSNGEVWVASLDGVKKARLAAPEGTQKWLAVAASDGGRIVAARNEPGKIASLSWFKVWEADGTSTVEGPLNYPGGWQLPVYPLGFDVTADGKHMVYGYSNSSCCPYTFGRGTYVRPVTNSILPPIAISGYEEPTLFGSRVIAKSGSTVYAQTSATTYGTDFEPRVDVSASGLELRRTDVAATGKLLAIELEQWDGGTQKVGKIAVLSADGVDGNLTGAVDCFLPAAGIAKDVSLAQDGRSIAWTDDQGLKVGGEPTTANDECTLASPPVVIAPGGTSPSIGGADVTAFLPPPPPVTPTPPGPPAGAAPVTTPPPKAPALPAKVTAKALTSGLVITVGAPGKVTVTASVAGKKVGSGTATAKGAGKVTIKLKLTKAGRKLARKGKKVTLKVTQAGRSTTKTVKLA